MFFFLKFNLNSIKVISRVAQSSPIAGGSCDHMTEGREERWGGKKEIVGFVLCTNGIL